MWWCCRVPAAFSKHKATRWDTPQQQNSLSATFHAVAALLKTWIVLAKPIQRRQPEELAPIVPYGCFLYVCLQVLFPSPFRNLGDRFRNPVMTKKKKYQYQSTSQNREFPLLKELWAESHRFLSFALSEGGNGQVKIVLGVHASSSCHQGPSFKGSVPEQHLYK